MGLLVDIISSPGHHRTQLEQLAPSRIVAVQQLARAHGVLPWLAAERPGGERWQGLAEQRLRFIAARSLVRAEIDRFGSVVDDKSLPWLVLKGQATAEEFYPAPWLRYGVDIDVLIRPVDFPVVVELLVEHGWTLIDRNWPLFCSTMPGQLRLRSATGGLFDLHWNVMDDPRLRASFPLPTEQLLERSRRLESGLPVLAAVDQLVHLALHAAQSGAGKLMWLVDLDLAARRVADWAAVVAAARTAHAGPAIALVLARAHRWLGTPVPAGVLSELSASHGWPWLCAWTDRVSPLDAHPERPALRNAFARSARQTAAASIVELGRHAARFILSGAPRSRPRSPLQDPTDPRSPLFSADDLACRRKYLASVVAAAHGGSPDHAIWFGHA